MYIQENMLSKFGILAAILVMVLLFYFVISFGAGFFSKGEKKPEIKKYLENDTTLEECIVKGQQVTRNYVKRQHTWWNSSKLEIFHKFDKFPDEIDINAVKFE